MVSVVQRIRQYNREVKQPRGGFLNPKLLTMTQLEDGAGPLDLAPENLDATVIGTAVDYLTRLAVVRTDDPATALKESFAVSLRGAHNISEMTEHVSTFADAVAALQRLQVITEDDGMMRFEIDATAVEVSCHLATYDTGTRGDPAWYNPESSLKTPNTVTIEHILHMVVRSRTFFAEYGPVTNDGFVFANPAQYMFGDHGGYTDLVDSGDGDFLTTDTLWDFKVSKNPPTKDHTLQLLMYFFMGKKSGLAEFADLTHIGIFNPRLNRVYRIAMADVPGEALDTVCRDVIGYDEIPA